LKRILCTFGGATPKEVCFSLLQYDAHFDFLRISTSLSFAEKNRVNQSFMKMNTLPSAISQMIDSMHDYQFLASALTAPLLYAG
jgi:hypothetical protein